MDLPPTPNDHLTDYEYLINKRTDKIYLSKLLEIQELKSNKDTLEFTEITRPLRIVSTVIDCNESHEFIKEGHELSLRITSGNRQEIKIKFYQDTRDILSLQIQKYTIENGNPHKTYFTFQGEEILKLYNFIRNIPILPIIDNNSSKLDDQFVNELILSKEQIEKVLHEHPKVIEEILKNDITLQDLVNLGYRKNQLEIFKKLLNNDDFFQEEKRKLGTNKRDEDVFQSFFEKNTWIFGYGLNYVFNSPLDERKLEQVTKGSSVFGHGKRVDLLLKTRGIINTFCFGEIKTPKTRLLKDLKNPYRPECWNVSDELTGGISQIQKTVQKSIEEIKNKVNIKDDKGNPTGEEIYLFKPKSFLIVGSLSEFNTPNGINEDKFSSFELFRQSLSSPEIITFDELYERTRFIVESSENVSDIEDLPF